MTNNKNAALIDGVMVTSYRDEYLANDIRRAESVFDFVRKCATVIKDNTIRSLGVKAIHIDKTNFEIQWDSKEAYEKTHDFFERGWIECNEPTVLHYFLDGSPTLKFFDGEGTTHYYA